MILAKSAVPLWSKSSQSPKQTTGPAPSLLTFAIDPKDTEQSILKNPTTSTYRLRIPKIGVDMPIIVGEKSEQRGLAKGAWLIPGSALPVGADPYGNTVLSGHRYLRTTGPNTFFNLDKLKPGDEINIEWQGSVNHYTVSETKVVPPSAIEVLNPTPTPTLTLFTCTPVFTTKNRLVIIAKPLTKN